MSEIDKKESPKIDADQTETGVQKGDGLGELFKREREKLGLSVEQVVEVTRLRKHFVEALENEDWDNLPPGVFVRGFIKAYAQIVGLDEKNALSLYESSSHAESVTPKPLVKAPRTRIGPILFLATLLLGIAVLILWILYPFSVKTPLQPVLEPSSEPRREPSIAIKAGDPDPEKSEMEIEPEAVIEEPKIKPIEAIQKEQKQEIVSREAEARQESAVNPSEITEPEPGIEPAPTQFVLTGHVKERTWIRICVDDQEPKEYIFQPGSRPQWKGFHGFNALIGNAAGIDFDFNEEKYANLGEQGKVVRLKLPKNFTGSKCEE